jgi:hypothetical protein
VKHPGYAAFVIGRIIDLVELRLLNVLCRAKQSLA